jgi:hypothetical protein
MSSIDGNVVNFAYFFCKKKKTVKQILHAHVDYESKVLFSGLI